MKFRNQALKYGRSENEFIDKIPEFGFMRLRHIIGDSKADPPIPPIIPVCASSWWAGVKTGVYPQPVKLGPNTTAWKVDDIKALIERINGLNDSKIHVSGSGNTQQIRIAIPHNFLARMHEQLIEGVIRDVIGQLYFGEEISQENKSALHFEGINSDLIKIFKLEE